MCLEYQLLNGSNVKAYNDYHEANEAATNNACFSLNMVMCMDQTWRMLIGIKVAIATMMK